MMFKIKDVEREVKDFLVADICVAAFVVSK